MAVLFTSDNAPVVEFFYSTPPRKVVCCDSPAAAVAALLKEQCNHRYALVPNIVKVPAGLEIRARRPGFVLFQKNGHRTRSDRRHGMLPGSMPTGYRPRPPYFSE